jgi:Arc/MetJ-type ribon-helix-helix transcriptional regulator
LDETCKEFRILTVEQMMGILEKLRPLPRWKHADPAVRAAAVYELGLEEDEALRLLAREDPEARVRRAAVTRLDDISLLGEIARTDPDEDVRAEAVRVLAGLAAETSDVARAVDVVRQLTAAGRSREIVVIARENVHVDVRTAVVEALDDPKALGSVSRHAPDGQTRLRALGRLADGEELLNVALKAEHTDVAVAALERVSDLEALGAIGQRGRSKVAARRARTKLRQIEDAARPAAEEPAVAMSAEDRERAFGLLRRAEALVTIGDPDAAAMALADVRLGWAELQADAEVPEPMTQQFESASDAVREAIVERQQEHAAEQERARALAREQADRLAIVEQIERLDAPDAQDRIAELRVQWDALPPMPSEYAASLTRRFQDASRAFEGRERRRALAAAAAGRLETLATELEQLLASDQVVEEIVARWRGLRRDADVLREYGSANPQASERLEQAVTALEAKEHEHQQLRTRQEQDNLRRLQQLCRQLDVLVAAETLTLKAGDRALRDIRAALDERLPLPSKKDRQDMQARLEAARSAIAPRVQELRDADEWQRWANVQVQEELCREMEALKAEEDLDRAGRRMRELQGRWKQVALAPRAQGEVMWRRFKTAQDDVYARTASHAAAQNAERGANLARKEALCAQAGALADSTEWVKTAAAVQALQAEWKTIGPVNRGHERAIWERFRAACDRFFTRRQEDLKRRKDDWNANFARKEALCVAAESLAESTDWEAAAATVKKLQAEWKTIGPVRKSRSEAIWQRFRTACDHFFDRYKHRDQLDLQDKAAARDALIRELEALLPAAGSPAGDAPDQLPAIVQAARTRWQQAPELPRGLQQDLAAKYHQALGRLVAAWPAAFAGSDIDPEQTRKRMEKLVARVEELVPSQGVQRLSPAELLAQQWRERLAANTISGGAGKAVETEESRWRAAEQEIRNAQAQWTRFGPVPAEVAGPLNERFQRACRRFYDQRRKAS